MKILAGKFKNQNLHSFSKTLPIRPMTQRVKKSVFDVLTPCLRNSTVLDLFSGSGSLSFESLSRGAASCWAVEKHPLCQKLIQKNKEKLCVSDSEFYLYKGDVFKFLKSYKGPTFQIIFLDPPFRFKQNDFLIKNLKKSCACDRDSLVVFELPSRTTLSSPLISIRSKKKFGDKMVYFFHIQGSL